MNNYYTKLMDMWREGFDSGYAIGKVESQAIIIRLEAECELYKKAAFALGIRNTVLDEAVSHVD